MFQFGDVGGLLPPLFAIIKVVKQPLMFDKQLKPYFGGRVLANESAMKDPIVQAVLKDMQARNWEDRTHPTGHWWISDRH